MSLPQPGLRANWRQFSLLVVINAFVGGMIGLERTVVPLLARDEFAIASTTVALSFILAFGVTKSVTNLAAGALADRIGRKRLLVTGWLAAAPVPALVIWGPSWGWIVAANVLLGVNQGLAWSMTVVMKMDLAGPARRGLALGLNESAGYVSVAVAAAATGALAASHGPRPVPFLMGFGFVGIGLALSAAVRDTGAFVSAETRGEQHDAPFASLFRSVSWSDRTLSSAAQAGLVNNLNDAMAWGLFPLLLASRGLSFSRIGAVTAAYPLAWGLSQLGTGALSDRVGRRPLIVGGLWLQAAAIATIAHASGYGVSLGAAAAMGVGTALVYPTLLAVVGDVVAPGRRAGAVGIYRFWRDAGYVVGALLAGAVADAFGFRTAVDVVAAVTAASGVLVAARMAETLPRRPPTAGAASGAPATAARRSPATPAGSA